MRHARPAARLTVLVGPSGAGTQSVIGLIRARSPLLWLPVRVTTRTPRGQERDGEHYHFMDPEEFDRRIAAGDRDVMIKEVLRLSELLKTTRVICDVHRQHSDDIPEKCTRCFD